MERAVAIKKLGKILGKSLGYRVDAGAPLADERAAARQQLPALNATKKQAEDAMEARRKAVLAADAEYQALIAAHKEARDRAAAVAGIAHHFRVTVGVSSGMFFHVKAQGDSWEDVIAQLTRKEQRAEAEG